MISNQPGFNLGGRRYETVHQSCPNSKTVSQPPLSSAHCSAPHLGVAAARNMNTHGWYSLVDWSLSGVGRMVEALHAVDKPRSENMAKRGLTELLQSPENTLALSAFHSSIAAGNNGGSTSCQF